MWDVHQLAVFMAQDPAEAQKPCQRGFRSGEGHAFKVRWQRVNVAEFLPRANQDVGVLLIQAAQGAQHVADVSTHAKIANAPDVYGDLHGESIDRKPSCGRNGKRFRRPQAFKVSQVLRLQSFEFRAALRVVARAPPPANARMTLLSGLYRRLHPGLGVGAALGIEREGLGQLEYLSADALQGVRLSAVVERLRYPAPHLAHFLF